MLKLDNLGLEKLEINVHKYSQQKYKKHEQFY